MSQLIKRKNLYNITKEGVTADETDSLFAMMDSIKASENLDEFGDVRSYNPPSSTHFGKMDQIPVSLQDYPGLKTLVKTLPKSYIIQDLLKYPRFRRQILTYALKVLRNRIV